MTKLQFDDSPEAHGHGKILGGGMVGTHAGDMIGRVALAIEMGADAVDIGKTFPLLCPMCGGQMRLIALITESAQIKRILEHIGVDSEPPHISPARGPPLWDDCGDAQMGEGVEVEPHWDLAAQPAPDFDVDQRVNW